MGGLGVGLRIVSEYLAFITGLFHPAGLALALRKPALIVRPKEGAIQHGPIVSRSLTEGRVRGVSPATRLQTPDPDRRPDRKERRLEAARLFSLSRQRPARWFFPSETATKPRRQTLFAYCG